MGTWTNEASRRGGTSQLHTCLQVITCWLNDHLKEALETYYYPHLSDQVNALLAVSQCLVKLWSRAEGDNAALFDPEGIDLCAELIGRMACSLRKATIKVWADMRRLSDDVKSVPVEIVGFCHDLHRLLYELCLNLPSQDVPDTPIPSNTEMEGSKRVLQMLLPALEAPLSIPPPFHLQLAEQEAKATWQSVEEWEITAKRLKSLIQPSIQLKHSKQRSASSQLPAEGHAAASGDDDEQQVDGVVKMLWWSCSDDGHAKIMTDLILSSIKSESEEEEEEDMNRKEEKSDEDDLSLLRTAARGISGPVFRAIDRLISSVSHPSLGNLLSSSLSLILPYCSINQSKRLLGIVIPSLIATYADQEAEQWWSGKSVIASTGFSIHVLFRSLPLAVSSAVDQGQKQAIMDRCLSLLSSHLKKNLVISDMSSWSLVLTALNESLICHQSLLSIPSTDAGYNKEDESLSFDFGALLALALSFVQVLCSPPLSLFTSTDGFKALVKQVVDVLQGRVARDEKAHAFVEQVAMAGSRTADDYWQGIVSKGEIEDIAVESWTLLDNLFLLIQ